MLYALKARAARLPQEAFKCAALRSAGGADEMLIKPHFVKHFVAPASRRQAEGSCPRGRIIQVIRLMICSDARMRKIIYTFHSALKLFLLSHRREMPHSGQVPDPFTSLYFSLAFGTGCLFYFQPNFWVLSIISPKSITFLPLCCP